LTDVLGIHRISKAPGSRFWALEYVNATGQRRVAQTLTTSYAVARALLADVVASVERQRIQVQAQSNCNR
jgi:hypothetical protein